MNRTNEVRERLQRLLEDLDYQDLQVSVDIERGYRLVAVVTTPGFEGVSEFERQATVWGAVYDEFDIGDELNIDFIFTNTPAEEEEMERQEQLRL